MKSGISALIAIVLSASGATLANNDHHHGHDEAPASQSAHVSGEKFSFGEPGDPAKSTRTFHINALDTMKFSRDALLVKKGETVRFMVHNDGKVVHEFVIGDAETQKAHAEMMKTKRGMKHDHANAVTIEPGKAKNLYWTFSGEATELEIGCHVPGHYESGMKIALKVE